MITAEELDRTQRRLVDEPHVRGAGDFMRYRIMLGMLRSFANAVASGDMAAEDFERQKASYLEALCEPMEPEADE